MIEVIIVNKLRSLMSFFASDNKSLRKKNSLFFIKNFILFVTLMITTSCFESDLKVALKKNEKNQLKITVSRIEVKDNQVIITGTNLNAVSHFSIKDNSNVTDLQIESKTNQKIVANTLANVTLVAGKILDFIFSSAQASSKFIVDFSLCDSKLGGKGFDCSLTPNDKEVLSYDAASGLWKPRPVNGITYVGAWDALNDDLPLGKATGEYYIVSVANAPYNVGDWIVFNGTIFDRIDNSQAIISVFGRTGAIAAQEGDYNLNKMSDVSLITPVNNDVLMFNGTQWINTPVSFSETDPSVRTFAKNALPTCNTNEVLKSNGTTFSCVTDKEGAGFSGSANRVIVSSGAADLVSSSVTTTELDYLQGVSSNIQTQLNTKISVESDPSVKSFAKLILPTCSTNEVLKSNGTTFSCVTDEKGADAFSGISNLVVLTNGSGALATSTISNVELGYLNGVSSNIQTQFSGKQATINSSTSLSTGGILTNLQNAIRVNPFSTGVGNTGELRFYELAGNGSDYTGFKSPDNLSANLIYVLPQTAPGNNEVLTSNASGQLSWSSFPSAPVTSVNTKTGIITLTSSDIAEGTNQYHTTARVLGSQITAPTIINSAIATSDTIQTAFGKLQGQFNNILSITLASLSTATNSAITASDSILSAFGKLQAQINSNSSSLSNKADTTNGAQSITASNISVTTINGGVIPDLSKAVLNEGGAPSIQIGTLAAMPAASAGNLGRMYVVKDSGNEAIFVSSGSAWIKIASNGINGTLDSTTALPNTIVQRGPAGEVYGQYLVPNTTAVEDGTCTLPVGTIAKDAAGNLLTCQ